MKARLLVPVAILALWCAPAFPQTNQNAEQMKELRQDIKALSERFSNVETRIGNLETKIAGIEATLNAVNEKTSETRTILIGLITAIMAQLLALGIWGVKSYVDSRTSDLVERKYRPLERVLANRPDILSDEPGLSAYVERVRSRYRPAGPAGKVETPAPEAEKGPR